MRKVLFVEDSSTILALIKLELRKHPYIEPYFATSYKEAMHLIRKNGGNFHAALLDLTLPDSKDGDVVKLALSHNIPSIVLSATLDKLLKDTILKMDIIDFVIKDDPGSIEFALKSIARVLTNYDKTVLVVDDSKTYRTVISNALKKINLNILEAQNGKEALEVLEKNKQISLIVTDLEMPVMDGLELTLNIRKKYKKDQISIIAISSVQNQESTTKFLKFGANDFIHKPFSDNEIITRINSNIELLELFSQIRDMANKDFLTGMFNRRYFFDNGESILEKNIRKNTDITVAMVDIDKFKNINDTYGHDIGDIAIKEVANILEKNLRKSDLVARFGGEEFCILLEDISLEEVNNLFEKIRESFQNNVINIETTTLSYTVSTGIYYGIGDNLDNMVKSADEALYDSKENGRNRVTVKSN